MLNTESPNVTFQLPQLQLLHSKQMKPYCRLWDIYSILAVKEGDWTRLLAGWQANKPDLATKRPTQIGMREREDIITVYNTSIIIIIIVGNRYRNEGRSSTKNGVIRLSVTEHTLCYTQNWFRKSATMYSASHYFGTILRISIRAHFFWNDNSSGQASIAMTPRITSFLRHGTYNRPFLL